MSRVVEGPAQGEVVSEVFGADKDGKNGVAVSYLCPTEGERRSMNLAAGTAVRDDEGTPDAERFLKYQYAVMLERVKSVDGKYSVRGKDIKTAQELVDYGEQDICDAVFNRVMTGDALTEEDEKKS